MLSDARDGPPNMHASPHRPLVGPSASAGSGGLPTDVAELQRMLLHQQQQMQQQQHEWQQQQQQHQLRAAAPTPVMAPAPPQLLVGADGIAQLLAHQQAALQQSSMEASVRMMAVQALGHLAPFSGKNAASGLASTEWLKQAERFFTAREAAGGIGGMAADSIRVMLAANALTEDAARWYGSLPDASLPATWAAFRACVLARYNSVPAARMHLDRLRSFVKQAAKTKLTLEGLQAYSARFTEYRNAVPVEYLTERGALELLGEGLPTHLREVCLREDAKEAVAPLHKVIEMVLARASFKDYVAHGAATSSSSSSDRNAMEVDSISLCAASFGISREEAASYVAPQEGWAMHDTRDDAPTYGKGSTSSSSPGAGAGTTSPTEASTVEQLLAALGRFPGANRDKGAGGSNKHQPGGRRSVPSGVRSDVPEALASARREAGLCIKCGIVKYEGGSRGHNSRTCQASADKSTSVADGRRKANF